MTAAPALRVTEVFGPTYQGEGPAVGRPATFVRLGGCPVGCSWCDTRYTWDPAQRAADVSWDVGALARHVLDRAGAADIVVITGGEPLAQQAALVPFAQLIVSAGHEVHLETAGVHSPDARLLAACTLLVVSPKLRSSGVSAERRLVPSALQAFADRGEAWFKFVVHRGSELDEVAEIVNEFGLRRVMVMPAGTDAETVLLCARRLADDVIARGWSLTPRWHILLWGDVRGR